MRQVSITHHIAISRTRTGAQIGASDPVRMHRKHGHTGAFQIIPQRPAKSLKRVFARHVPSVIRHSDFALDARNGDHVAAALLEVRQGKVEAVFWPELWPVRQKPLVNSSLPLNFQIFV